MHNAEIPALGTVVGFSLIIVMFFPTLDEANLTIALNDMDFEVDFPFPSCFFFDLCFDFADIEVVDFDVKVVLIFVPDTNGKDRVTSTTSTVSYRKEKVSTESSDSSTSKVKKKTSHSLSDFLTGSPLKTADKDKEKVKEKKEKKHGKFYISSPLKAHK